MKTLVRTLVMLLLFTAAALAFDTDYKTRIISSATLTIKVKDGQFVLIRNFTQDLDVGQRGIITVGVPAPSPTPTPTPTPTATPTATPTTADLIAVKSNSVGGNATFPSSWTWTIHVANGGNTAASFGLFQTILTDNLPNSNISYSSVSVTNPVNITNSAAINCTISGFDLSCSANDTVTIGPGGSFDVSFTATPSASGSFANPRAAGTCSVDPSNVVAENSDSNNTCADTVVSSVPSIVSGTVLTASISHTDGTLLAEYVKPVIIAGPATLTIAPVPGATLAITYKKILQPIQPTATATASASSTSTTLSTSSATTTLSVGTSTRSASVNTSAIADDDEIEWSTPSPKRKSTPTPAPSPTATPSVQPASPTPTPTIIPTPSPTPPG